MLKAFLSIGLVMFLIFNVSIAQIRYVLGNPFGTMDIAFQILVEVSAVAFAIYVIYATNRSKSEYPPIHDYKYSLLGSKGGKATKTRSRKKKKNEDPVA